MENFKLKFNPHHHFPFSQKPPAPEQAFQNVNFLSLSTWYPLSVWGSKINIEAKGLMLHYACHGMPIALLTGRAEVMELFN